MGVFSAALSPSMGSSTTSKASGGSRSKRATSNEGNTTYDEINYFNSLVSDKIGEHIKDHHNWLPKWVQVIGGAVIGIVSIFGLLNYEGIVSWISHWQEDRIRQIIEEGNITVIKTASGSATIEMYKFEMKKEN